MRKTFQTGLVMAFAGILLLAGCVSNPKQAPETADTLPLEPCWLSHPAVSSQFEARCGTLEVYEDAAAGSGRTISLRVAVIPAESRSPEPDPVFLLAGGPGQAASEAYVPLLDALSRVNFKRDLVMVDQRGTGNSNPLSCSLPENVGNPVYGTSSDREEVLARVEDCVSALDGDLRYYTTENAARDLNAARAALGYEQINLLGVSYGTRTAQVYERMYPEQTRTLTLDGVVPMDWALGDRAAVDAQRALDLLFERCQSEAGCQEAFPGLWEEFDAFLDELDENPVEVTVDHPLTGEEVRVLLTRDTVGGAVRLLSYDSTTAALLPLLIHQAAVEHKYQPLAAQYVVVSEALSASISEGLYYSVLCAEDVPFYSWDSTSGGIYWNNDPELMRSICTHWPHASVTDAFHQPLHSEVPTLLISGEADPVTPPSNAVQVAAGLPNSLSVTVPEMGHGNLNQGCLPLLIRDFLEAGSVQELDAECVGRIKALPFFVSPVGPQP